MNMTIEETIEFLNNANDKDFYDCYVNLLKTDMTTIYKIHRQFRERFVAVASIVMLDEFLNQNSDIEFYKAFVKLSDDDYKYAKDKHAERIIRIESNAHQ